MRRIDSPSFGLKLLPILFSTVACLGCVSVQDKAEASEEMSLANALIQPIEDYRRDHGTYPNALSEIALPRELAAEAIRMNIFYGRVPGNGPYVLSIPVSGLFFDSGCGYLFDGRHEQKWRCHVK